MHTVETYEYTVHPMLQIGSGCLCSKLTNCVISYALCSYDRAIVRILL